MTFYNTMQNVVVQAIGGFVLGSLTDAFFPFENVAINKDNAIMATGELGLQIGVLGVGSSMFFDMIRRRGYRDDALGAIPFMIVFVVTQNNLTKRVQVFQTWMKSFLSSGGLSGVFEGAIVGGKAKPTQSPNTPGYQNMRLDGIDVPSDIDTKGND